MTDPIITAVQTDSSKLKTFFAKNGKYLLWAAFMFAGIVIGRII
jgi:hypothetical protein